MHCGMKVLTLFIPGFLAGVVPRGGGGCFPPPPCNSFVFHLRGLKFCTELLVGMISILEQEKSGSNR